jgi:hypothetical protein
MSEGTAVYCRSHHASRALATPAVERLVEMESKGASSADLAAFRGRGRAREGCILGDLDGGILPAGAAGRPRARDPAGREVVRDLARGFAEALASISARAWDPESAPVLPGGRPEAA